MQLLLFIIIIVVAVLPLSLSPTSARARCIGIRQAAAGVSNSNGGDIDTGRSGLRGCKDVAFQKTLTMRRKSLLEVDRDLQIFLNET